MPTSRSRRCALRATSGSSGTVPRSDRRRSSVGKLPYPRSRATSSTRSISAVTSVRQVGAATVRSPAVGVASKPTLASKRRAFSGRHGNAEHLGDAPGAQPTAPSAASAAGAYQHRRPRPTGRPRARVMQAYHRVVRLGGRMTRAPAARSGTMRRSTRPARAGRRARGVGSNAAISRKMSVVSAGDFASLPTDHPGDALRVLRIGDHQHRARRAPGPRRPGSVSRSPGRARRTRIAAFRPRSSQIERVHWLAVAVEHVVGDVDDVADRSHPDGRQARHEPRRDSRPTRTSAMTTPR